MWGTRFQNDSSLYQDDIKLPRMVWNKQKNNTNIMCCLDIWYNGELWIVSPQTPLHTPKLNYLHHSSQAVLFMPCSGLHYSASLRNYQLKQSHLPQELQGTSLIKKPASHSSLLWLSHPWGPACCVQCALSLVWVQETKKLLYTPSARVNSATNKVKRWLK